MRCYEHEYIGPSCQGCLDASVKRGGARLRARLHVRRTEAPDCSAGSTRAALRRSWRT